MNLRSVEHTRRETMTLAAIAAVNLACAPLPFGHTRPYADGRPQCPLRVKGSGHPSAYTTARRLSSASAGMQAPMMLK